MRNHVTAVPPTLTQRHCRLHALSSSAALNENASMHFAAVPPIHSLSGSAAYSHLAAVPPTRSLSGSSAAKWKYYSIQLAALPRHVLLILRYFSNW